jgi:CXXX repeat peptide maturase
MLKYVNVLLSDNAVSFCHYENKNSGGNKCISKELIKNIIDYCQTQNLFVNYIFPKDNIPFEILDKIEKTEHIKIAPYNSSVNADVVIITPPEIMGKRLPDNFDKKIIIIKIKKTEIVIIAELLEQLAYKYLKITLVLTDVELYNEEDIAAYSRELEKTEIFLFQQYKDVKESLPEINFITDIWFAKQMNNCNAGIDHYTFAPDGNFYICPAFYLYGGKNIGNLSEINVKNQRLFSLENAPICNVCDAFHCKRCVYLNNLLTEEFNTPSSQQCRLAHIERECSRKLLERLKKVNPLFMQIPPINIIDYNDPIEKILLNKIEKNKE